MLPDVEHGAVEHIRADVKGRWDFPVARPEGLMPGIPYRRWDRWLVSSYFEGDHFAWHRDDMIPATANRSVAISVMLSDPSEYDGGELELPEFGLSLKPAKGMLVSFPASALHRVTPITRGVRKVLLTFILKKPTP